MGGWGINEVKMTTGSGGCRVSMSAITRDRAMCEAFVSGRK